MSDSVTGRVMHPRINQPTYVLRVYPITYADEKWFDTYFKILSVNHPIILCCIHYAVDDVYQKTPSPN